MKLSTALIFALSIALSAHAITSERALQFWTVTNNIAFPDAVPRSAYYDDNPATEYKELRVTTNVASAVYSLVSGLIERQSWMREIIELYDSHTIDYDGLQFNDTESFYEFCKRGEMTLLEWPLTAYKYPGDRTVRTYRFAPAALLSNAREELFQIVNGNYRYEYDAWYEYGGFYGSPIHAGLCNMSSSWLMKEEYGLPTKFPTFDWTSNLVHTIREPAEWAETLPTMYSSAFDDLWNTNEWQSGTYYSFLALPLDWFSHFEDEWNDQFVTLDDVEWDYDSTNWTWNIIRDLEQQRSAVPPSETLWDTFGWDGNIIERFTNQTFRLDYYQLGTVEQAINSIDTSYSFTWPEDLCLKVENLWHHHSWSSLADDVIITNSATSVEDWDSPFGHRFYLTVPAISDSEWVRTERWETTTNETEETSSRPTMLCTGDDPSHVGLISARGVTISVSYNTIAEEMENLDINSMVINTASPYISISGGSFWFDFDYFALERSSTLFTVTAGATISRSTTVSRTLSEFPTNMVTTCLYHPPKMAFDSGIIDNVYVQSLQNRLVCRDCEFSSDADGSHMGWSLGTGVVSRAETRSISLGTWTDYNSIITRWRDAFIGLNDSLKTVLPYQLTPRENLLPITENNLKSLEQRVVNGGNVELFWSSTAKQMHFWKYPAADEPIMVTCEYEDGSFEEYEFEPDTEWQLGWMSGSTNITLEAEYRLPRRRPFAAEANTEGLHTTKWKFNSIRPDYE